MLTTVGVGADFNEYLMTALADAGTGNYYYLKAGDDLASVFAREFDAARATVASGLAVRIEPADGVRVRRRRRLSARADCERSCLPARRTLRRPGASHLGDARGSVRCRA